MRDFARCLVTISQRQRVSGLKSLRFRQATGTILTTPSPYNKEDEGGVLILVGLWIVGAG